MASISQISFDTVGWQILEKSATMIKWRNDIPDGMYLNFFDIPPDIPVSLRNIQALQASYWQGINAQGGGLVSLDVIEIEMVPTIKQIVKIPIPNQQHGLLYLASFTIPFGSFSYVVKFQCQEWGTTGIRESVVVSQALAAGQIQIGDGNGKIVGWTPYPNSDMNLAEDETYDAMFPQHPLSRARHYLNHVQTTIKLDGRIVMARRFDLPD